MSISTYRTENETEAYNEFTHNWFQDQVPEWIEFIDYISKNCAVGADDECNLVIIDKKIRCYIPPNRVYDVFTRYEKCRLRGINMHITEKCMNINTDYRGIMLDFDIYQNTGVDLLSDSTICNHVVKVYLKHLGQYINLFTHEPKHNIYVFITSRPIKPQIDGDKQVYRDGFHVLIPEIRVHKHTQKAVLMMAKNDLIDVFKADASSKIINITDDEGLYGDLVDFGSVSVPVYLLGSDKISKSNPNSPPKPPHKIKFIYKAELNQDYEGGIVTVMNSPDKFRSHYHKVSYECSLIFNYEGIEYKSFTKKRDYLPKNIKQIHAITTTGKKVSKTQEDEHELFTKNISIHAINDPKINTVKDLSDMLSISRMEDYNSWWRYVILMASISGGDDTYRSIAKLTSMRASNYRPHDPTFDKVWNSGRVDNGKKFTIGTLYFWASADNPVKYQEWQKQNIDTTIKKIVLQHNGKINHYQTAQVLKIMFLHKYKYNAHYNKSSKSIFDGPWFEFVTDKDKNLPPLWSFKYMPSETPYSLEEFIASSLPSLIKQYADKIKNDMEHSEDKSRKDALKRIHGNLLASIYNFGMVSFIKGTLDMCKKVFRDELLYEKMDKTKYIMAVQNGILDINPRSNMCQQGDKFRCHLIQDKHDYFVSRVTPIPYTIYGTVEDKINELMQRIFIPCIPEDDMREFFLLFVSTGICNNVTKDLLFLQCCGEGENGKSIITTLNENTLGELMYPCPVSILSFIDNDPGRHSSHITALEGRGLINFNESEPNVEVSSSALKKILSGENIPCREAHGKQTKIKLCSNFMGTSNYPLNINVNDHGTWRRIMSYNFKVRFVHGTPQGKYERKADPSIADFVDDPLTQEAYLALLVHYYEKLQNEYGGSLKNIPPSVIPTIYSETQTYRNSQDHINNFIYRNIVWSPEVEMECDLSEVSMAYKKWYETRIGTSLKHSIASINGMFKRSRLSKFIIQKPNGDRIVTKHRLLRGDDEPEEGELTIQDYDMNTTTKLIEVVDDDDDDDADGEDYIYECHMEFIRSNTTDFDIYDDNGSESGTPTLMSSSESDEDDDYECIYYNN